jgi:hypothetical protein
MTMLAEQVDGVIGVDTHRDTLAAAAVSAVGAVLAHAEAVTGQRGYRELLAFAREQIPGPRCWALEATGSYGAGVAAFLEAAGERVVEVCRPKRPPQRGGRKTDAIEAVRAAREALTAEHLIHPRRRGEREALRVLLVTRQGAVTSCTAAINHLKAMLDLPIYGQAVAGGEPELVADVRQPGRMECGERQQPTLAQPRTDQRQQLVMRCPVDRTEHRDDDVEQRAWPGQVGGRLGRHEIGAGVRPLTASALDLGRGAVDTDGVGISGRQERASPATAAAELEHTSSG